MVTAQRPEVTLTLELRGGNRDLFAARDPEILAEGPAGTGKTRTILELVNLVCHRYPGVRWLFLRKHAVTLSTTALVTFDTKVLHNGDGVRFFGGNQHEPPSYIYGNGSRIVVGGMDNPDKILSSEYDGIYANEATELTLDEWELLTTRLRNGILPNPRIIGDCNPTYSKHWLMQRTDAGKTRLIRSQLKDNPAYYTAAGQPTAEGERYSATLDRLTGTRYERFRLGLRVGVENACYPMFDRTLHIRPLEPGLQFTSIIGEDYGSEHLCAVAALSIDQYNRRWVREVWAGTDEKPDPNKPSSMDLVVAQFKEKYKARRGRVDPNQAKLAQLHGFNVAKGGRIGAPRLTRIDDMENLFYSYAGGRVPTAQQIKALSVPRGPFAEPDSPGIFLVEGMPGIDELADEIEAYHFVFTETPKGRSKDVYRVDDDRIAAVEYANEEWEEYPYHILPSAPQPARPQLRRARPWVRT